MCDQIIRRVASRVIQSSYFQVGDSILYGRYKNHRGQITSFGVDKWGNPTVTISPIPLGRKKPKTFGLFRIWKAEVKEKALAELEAQQRAKGVIPSAAEGATSSAPVGGLSVDEFDDDDDWDAVSLF